MYIKKLELYKYRRFSLTNIEKITYTPETPIQIILGTNGSGKSSLVRELTPLPSDIKKDFNQGGYKYIEIEHENKLYEIKSGINGGIKHSFKVNGEEHNISGIKKIQLQLVLEHFKLTPHIHEILLGNTTFTSMSSNDRKKWLSYISNLDYSYSIGVYNRLKQNHRDILGGIKLLQNKLVEDDTKLISKEEKEELLILKEIYSRTLDNLLSNKEQVTPTNTLTKEEIQQDITKAKLILSKLAEYDSLDIDDIDMEITKLNIDIANNKKSLTKLNNELKELNKLLSELTTNYSIEELNRSLKEVLNKVEELKSINVYNLPLEDIKSIYDSYTYILSDFISILNELNDYSDIYYSLDNIKELQANIDNINTKLDKTTSILNKYITEKEHMDKHKEDGTTTCPKCSYSWVQGYDEIRYKELLKNIDKYATIKTNLKEEHTKLTKLFNKYNEKNIILSNARGIITNNKQLLPIFKYVMNGEASLDIQKDTSAIISNLNEASIRLNTLLEYPKLQEKIKSIEDKIAIYKINSNLRKDNVKNDIAKTEEKISKLVVETNNYVNKLKLYKVYSDSMKELSSIHNKLLSNSSHMYKMLGIKIVKEKNNIINELIQYFKLELSKLEKQLSDSDLIEDRIKVITKDLEEYKQKEKVLKILVKELSPSEGLIAKSINSFLNVFIAEINNIINSIWSYDMSILPCEVSADNDLDYKFKVLINNDEVIDDVSKGSSSMKEIIDLAFKIVFMKYLGIINGPLVLDEFGKTMDPVHRINAFNAINNNLANIFKQIFIISHFESMYGAYANSDVSIISTNNINIDKDLEYNKVLKIE